MKKLKFVFVVLLIGVSCTLADECAVTGSGDIKVHNCNSDNWNFDQIPNPQDITWIDASVDNNKFPILKDGTFEKFGKLQKLYLSNCGISEIAANAFQGLSELKELLLNFNNISSLNKNWLEPLKKLEVLGVINNKIQILPEDLFEHNGNLRILSLDDNYISTLPDKVFAKLENLEEISIRNSNITTLSKKLFKNSKKLQKIYLGQNHISNIERETFKDLNNLTDLSLAVNVCINEDYVGNITGDLANKLNDDLQTCYKNYKNNVEKSTSSGNRYCAGLASSLVISLSIHFCSLIIRNFINIY